VHQPDGHHCASDMQRCAAMILHGSQHCTTFERALCIVCVHGHMATCIDSYSSIVCEVSASSGVTHRHSHRAVAGDDNRSRVNDGVGRGTSCGPIAAVSSRRRVPTICVPVASHRARGCTTARERERPHRPPSPCPHAWLQCRKSVQYTRCYDLSSRWM
jgi:hypothetical protein